MSRYSVYSVADQSKESEDPMDKRAMAINIACLIAGAKEDTEYKSGDDTVRLKIKDFLHPLSRQPERTALAMAFNRKGEELLRDKGTGSHSSLMTVGQSQMVVEASRALWEALKTEVDQALAKHEIPASLTEDSLTHREKAEKLVASADFKPDPKGGGNALIAEGIKAIGEDPYTRMELSQLLHEETFEIAKEPDVVKFSITNVNSPDTGNTIEMRLDKRVLDNIKSRINAERAAINEKIKKQWEMLSHVDGLTV